ncbi:MAG: tRNA (adenosine(37)-N6)-threonylcarbamoyltransferase complex ATPase subunit type 1 TsaE [Elusimicrobiota bacterium]|nr:tRNA (adenosine(37)-N6)-threonylcarbamoyltransferase complex ATPase subunit type 1 TsaE [Elusimicrobiota bacterium]
MENLVITTHSAEETLKFGAGLAERLKEGDNLLLLGELGAGKTTLLQGLGRGLGIKRNIISPTFQLVRKYSLECGKEFVHIDLYRLNSDEEILHIGWREMTEGSPIVAVEWADRAKEIWPDNSSYIINMAVSGKDRRRIELIEPG